MIKLKDLLFEGHNDSDDSAGICLYSTGKLLCCKRTDSYWSVPKGRLYIGEEPVEGAKREFTEETQIMLNGEPELVLTKSKNKGKFHLFRFETEKRPVPHLDHEHSDWGYFDVTNLPQPFDEVIMEYIESD
jgi:ADP-ribose pyrophosphatase YjhB (NUDIX family)|tara:strand:+ start:141 stop:533 length:393 start_codon:yes stop_codon:yes gene_type:complete